MYNELRGSTNWVNVLSAIALSYQSLNIGTKHQKNHKKRNANSDKRAEIVVFI